MEDRRGLPSLARRSCLAALALALLATSCADPAESDEPVRAVVTPPSSTPTPAPTGPAPVDAGEQLIPATCDELIPASQARLDLEFRSPDRQTVGAVIGVTAGLLACVRGPLAPGFDVSVYVLAVSPSDWQARLRDAGASESNGVLVERICTPGASFCGARLSTDAYAAELFVTDNAATGSIGSELDLIAAELSSTLASLPDPGEGPTPSAQPLGMPKDCAALDISTSPVANEIALLLASREPNPGSGDGPSLYYAAEARTGALWCVWTDGSDSMELYLVPGGGWAVDKPGALLPGAALDVEGADAARWTDSPFVEESVFVVARIGDDLALLGLRDYSVDAVIAEDRVDLAGRVLEAFIGSLVGASR